MAKESLYCRGQVVPAMAIWCNHARLPQPSEARGRKFSSTFVINDLYRASPRPFNPALSTFDHQLRPLFSENALTHQMPRWILPIGQRIASSTSRSFERGRTSLRAMFFFNLILTLLLTFLLLNG